MSIMRRGPSPSNALYIVGRVRVVGGKNGRFRILWYQATRQRERTATTFDRAKEIAREVEAELEGLDPSAPEGTIPFAKLVYRAVDPKAHQWSENWADRQLRYANLHVVEALGKIECSRLDKSDIITYLDQMVSEGYSIHTIDKVRKVIKRSVEEGIAVGIWQPGRHPMVGVTNPTVDRGRQDGKPDLKLIPTGSQVEELITFMRDDRPIYGVMAEVAAFTGVRWGELLALRREVIDLESANLTVSCTCVENDRGRMTFTKPRKTGRAKTTAPSREIPLESRLTEVLGDWIENLPTRSEGSAIDGTQPKGLLFVTDTGNPFRRSAFGKAFRRNAGKVDGWPTGAAWGYLRHFAATRWINPPPAGLGIEVPTASKMLGHSNVSTTYEWYVNVDQESLDRARARMP